MQLGLDEAVFNPAGYELSAWDNCQLTTKA